jgi:ribonuclease BN (tRNA processing enzyme)
VREAMEVFFPGSSQIERRFDVRFTELTDQKTLPLGSISVTPFGVVHASGAPPFALRVAGDGKIVAYSGDTEWTDSLIDVARGADLFIAEAYFFDKAVKFHLDLATLLRHRAELDCRRLIVTHMNEDMLARRDVLEVETAEDGKVVDV